MSKKPATKAKENFLVEGKTITINKQTKRRKKERKREDKLSINCIEVLILHIIP